MGYKSNTKNTQNRYNYHYGSTFHCVPNSLQELFYFELFFIELEKHELNKAEFFTAGLNKKINKSNTLKIRHKMQVVQS